MRQPLLAGGGGQGKKLTEAARRWAKARRAPSGQPAQHVPGSLTHINARLGVAAAEPDEIVVWPELRAGWELFQRFLTQLRHAGMSGAVIGLDYTPILLWLQSQVDDRARRDELLEQVQWCEAGLLAAIAEDTE